jgi:hypothetical protein
VHCLASRGLWNTDGQWIPVPYIDANAAEKLFRFKILRFLKRKGLLDDERIELLMSFQNSGFSVDTADAIGSALAVCPIHRQAPVDFVFLDLIPLETNSPHARAAHEHPTAGVARAIPPILLAATCLIFPILSVPDPMHIWSR